MDSTLQEACAQVLFSFKTYRKKNLNMLLNIKKITLPTALLFSETGLSRLRCLDPTNICASSGKRNQYFSYHCLQCLFSKAKQQFGRNSEGCVENTLSTVHTNKLFQISPCLKMSLCVIKSDLPGNAIHRSNY